MKLGSPGFVGERLRQARVVRGLSKTELAKSIGVSQPSVTGYEAGSRTPQPEVTERIIDVLQFPREFFWKAAASRSATPIFYRSLAAATKASRERSEERLGWLVEIARDLQQYVKFPAVNIPEFEVPVDPTELSDARIEEIAGELRWRWRLGEGAISDVILLLENNGIVVCRMPLGARALDAFSQWDEFEGRPYIVLSDEKESAVRSRFDAAHELAHLVLHRRVRGSVVRKSELFKLMERQAHRFAGAFLLPAASYVESLPYPSLEVFLELKPRWKVSIGLMIRRCANLGIINSAQAAFLSEQYGRRRWRTREPLDDQIPAEHTRLIRRALELLFTHGVKTRESLVAETGFPPDELEQLAGLPAGYFQGDSAIVKLRDSFAEANDSRRVSGSSRVIQFPRGGDTR